MEVIMKKIMTALLAALCIITSFGGAFAYTAGEARVTIGANLDDTQVAQIYADFGVKRGEVEEIIVTNSDEREYLEGLVDEKKIGSVALSCVYISLLDEGEGLSISTKNINWCTEQMYINALTTAGITDAKVMVSAPFAVSGTAALTGVYKAYEDITGKSLSSLAKAAGAEELILTGQLAEYIGSDEAAALINELKGILDITENMSDADVKTEIRKLADQYDVAITDAQIDQILNLCRKLEKLDVSELQDKLISITKTVQKASETTEKVGETVSLVTEKIKNFFGSVTGFFAKLFN